MSRLLGKLKPRLMVTDPPYGIGLDSEWRDRAGLNGCGPAEASYMKKRTAGHTETTISGDTRAEWSEAFALVPSLGANSPRRLSNKLIPEKLLQRMPAGHAGIRSHPRGKLVGRGRLAISRSKAGTSC